MSDVNPNLIDQLTSPSARERATAAKRLAQLGGNAQSATVPLVDAMADSDESVVNWASEALENLGLPPAWAVEPLADRLQLTGNDVAYWSATLLGRLCESASPAVDRLVTALESHPGDNVRQQAAWALGCIGPAAATAIPALERNAADTGRLGRLSRTAIDQIRN